MSPLSRKWPELVTLLLAVCTVGSCNAAGHFEGPLVTEVSRLADTAVVKVVSGSAWEEAADLRQELRLGTLEGEAGEAFGDIAHVAVAPDGTIFVFDRQVPTIYRFDRSGKMLGPIGREGRGPGEYGARPTGMVVASDRLLVADPSNARISAFGLAGEYLGTAGNVTGLRSTFSKGLMPLADGAFGVPILTVEPEPGEPLPTPWPIGIEVRSETGSIQDTIMPQGLLGRTASLMVPLPEGGVMIASDSVSVLEVRRSAEVVRFELPFQRVSYTPGERRSLGSALRSVAAADGGSDLTAPPAKPAYLEIVLSSSGRILARRPIRDRSEEKASWRDPRFQPSVLDVLDPAGVYFGVIVLPPRSRPVVATDEHLYVVELGQYGEQYVVRYRVNVPGSDGLRVAR